MFTKWNQNYSRLTDVNYWILLVRFNIGEMYLWYIRGWVNLRKHNCRVSTTLENTWKHLKSHFLGPKYWKTLEIALFGHENTWNQGFGHFFFTKNDFFSSFVRTKKNTKNVQKCLIFNYLQDFFKHSKKNTKNIKKLLIFNNL